MLNVDYFDRQVRLHSDRTLLIADGQSLTYREVHDLTHRAADPCGRPVHHGRDRDGRDDRGAAAIRLRRGHGCDRGASGDSHSCHRRRSIQCWPTRACATWITAACAISCWPDRPARPKNCARWSRCSARACARVTARPNSIWSRRSYHRKSSRRRRRATIPNGWRVANNRRIRCASN